MPKIAATMASLLLIASSIGVNIARYPQVGRTLVPAPAEAAGTVNPSPAGDSRSTADESPRVETANTTDPQRVKTATVLPTAEEQRLVKQELPAVSVSAKPAAPVPMEAKVPIIDVRPVARTGHQANGSDCPPEDDEVRRLPTVEVTGFSNADSEVTFANYPTTGTP